MRCLCAVMLMVLTAAIIIVAAPYAIAQSEHEKHHPIQQTSPGSDSAAAMPLSANDSGSGMTGVTLKDSTCGKADGMSSSAAGGMGAGMGEMMKNMGRPPNKELYPSMMELPGLSPEKRGRIKQLADERVTQGTALLAFGMGQLSGAAQKKDVAAMQEATDQIRQGQILLESGLSAQRALAESKDPRIAALQWFRRDMHLIPLTEGEQPQGFMGLSWFHYVSMFTLIAFAVIMIWMYFHKMQRANALIEKLAGKSPRNITSGRFAANS